MPDDLLLAIDEALASRTGRAPRRRPSRDAPRPRPDTAIGPATDADASEIPFFWRRPSRIEVYLAIQFLSGAVMFIPGAQGYRSIVRGLPYAFGLGLLALYLMRPFPGPRPGGSKLMMGALLLLPLNLLHSTSQLAAGIAQCIFQLSIAAPLFWAHKAVRSPRQLERLLVLAFAMNLLSAALGILQVYFPERFMPPQFSAMGLQLNDAYVDALTYVGNDGRLIIRPPGLTDLPGGAALAGALTTLFGLGLLLRTRSLWQAAGLLGAVAIGLAVIYLTQIRSVLLMAVAAAGILSIVALRRGRLAGGSVILGAGAALVIASFWWASSIGGAAIEERFLDIRDAGAIQTYRANRGQFLSSTLGEQLDSYPLGAGVGRWGMMNAYFGDNASQGGPLWVEIQLTGWLLDGGVLMWFLYGGAIVLSVRAGLRLSASSQPQLAESAIVVVAAQIFIAGMAMAGPAFNTQLGVLFWLLAAVVHGAASPLEPEDVAQPE